MVATLLNIPHDPVLGDVMSALDPSCVLNACVAQLTDVDADIRQSWRHARMIEALYHPGRYVRAAYVLVHDSSVPDNRLWPEGQLVYVHSPMRVPMSRRGTVLSLGGTEVEVYRFPNDRRLRGLRNFTGREACVTRWQEWLDASGDGLRIDPDSLQRLLVRYVPEQKWVVRLRANVTNNEGETRKHRIAIRACSSSLCEKLLSRHQHLTSLPEASDVGFIVPKVVGASVDSGLMAVEWRRGHTLLEALAEEPADEVMAGVARLLADLHRTPMPELEVQSQESIQLRVQNAVTDLTLACPALASQLEALGRKLVERISTLERVAPATLHNDFHWNQLRIKRGNFTLLDLERMVQGDPLVDVANFATQVRMLGRRAESPVSMTDANSWADTFLSNWQRVDGATIDPTRFHTFAALSLLELARGMMRHLRTDWPALAAACLDEVEKALSAIEARRAPA